MAKTPDSTPVMPPVDPHEEALLATAQQQAVYNSLMADTARAGNWLPVSEAILLNLEDVGLQPRHQYRSHTARPQRKPRGTSYPQPSDSDLDPNWNTQPAERTDAERDASHAAYLQASADLGKTLARRNIDRLHEAANKGYNPSALLHAERDRQQHKQDS